MRRILLLAALLLGGGGCGTILNFASGTQGGERNMIYGGVVHDGTVVGHMFSGESVHGVSVFWLGLCTIFDFPITLVLDTVTLPVTVGIEIFSDPPEKKKEP